MRHRKTGRTLGRRAAVREQLWRNQVASLLRSGSITTTQPKAKELRRYFEPLITRAKPGASLASRRQLLRKVKKEDLSMLLEIAKKLESRKGGYLRLTSLNQLRHDGAKMAKVEIIYE